ncbi:MAG: pyridoxine 5'-phosphate synthase [candidate division KSB1 bacterium]|nr:pyridoxine 5'-phosphate synthase [candidate division KSB1 bacterium]MDZ7345235.1 pyridoxine 5'-phosphate synthase [candidate division KSB1 bacterium]
MARLCLCINPIARIRAIKKGRNPDPVTAAVAAEAAGIDGIVVYVDESGEISDRDVRLLKEVVQTHLNIAVPAEETMVRKAVSWAPDMVTLLPQSYAAGEESPEEQAPILQELVEQLRDSNIVVAQLIRPDPSAIRNAARLQVDYVQLDTSVFSGIDDLGTMADIVEQFRSSAIAAGKLGLGVSAGRKLTAPIARELADAAELIEEYNVGWAIVSRAVLVGLEKAIADFRKNIDR